jgi:hypothetical protein
MRSAGLLRTTLRFKDRFLPCATNTLVNTRQGRRFAQAALKLCGSLEQRCDLGTCNPPTLFREVAAECIELARTASSPEKHALYMKMAGVWHQIAQRWEKKS